MKKVSRTSYALLAAALFAATAVYAQHAGWFAVAEPLAVPADPADLGSLSSAGMPIERTAPNLPNPFGVTHDQVGDADSFGSEVKWLGLKARNIYFGSACPRAGAGPEEYCFRIDNQTVETPFHFRDIASIELPAGASRSMICHWISPMLRITYQNTTTGNAFSYMRYWPTLVVTSDVLRDAGINPLTQNTFDGKLSITLGSLATWVNRPMAPGQVYGEWFRDSQVCMGGMLNRRMLIETYGLSEAQADALFASPMRLTIALSGNVRNVREAFMTYGVRFVGD